ncbi:hypothetical protein ACIRVF_03755 [Kitasatospora sp. NPDC101157]|uniref:hypothetical protein n=1 Tax=Kitasatospora sp. NPDC101157 TaxID=3364098 RepID=UPI00382F4F8E
MASPDFDAIADALYVLAPSDFTAARNERADGLKKADPRLAKRIRSLHRPTLAAWAANLLTHRHHQLVEQLLDLGEALRTAQEHLAGEQLRALADRRRRLVRALTEQARQEASAAGHPLGADAVADLDRTLSAALADPDAARALAEGRLTTALEPPPWPGAAPGGPEPAGRAEAVGAGKGPGPAKAPPAERAERAARRGPTAEAERQRVRRREREQEQEQELARAWQAATTAKQEEREAVGRVGEAEQALRGARSARRQAQDEAERALDEAERARDALARAGEREAHARAALARADEQLRAAEDAVGAAQEQAARSRESAHEAADRLRQLEATGRGGRSGRAT